MPRREDDAQAVTELAAWESRSIIAECAWCGAEIREGDGLFRRRAEPDEAYCTRNHRDAAQRAVRRLLDQ